MEITNDLLIVGISGSLIILLLLVLYIKKIIALKKIRNRFKDVIDIEEEVENLRRKITRDVADVGGLILNRDNILNTAYTMDEIGGYITGISFKLSNMKVSTIKTAHLDKDLTELIELVVDQIYKLNEIIRSLNVDSGKSIELAQETQKIEREIDIKYRTMTITVLNEITDTKELLLMKDVIELIEEMADKCQEVSDSFILLALSLWLERRTIRKQNSCLEYTRL